MANYTDSTGNRTFFPDKSLFMSAYVRINIDYPQDEREIEVKKNQLRELTYLVSDVLHRDVESEISIREGSVIAEIISSGNLSALLSAENLKAIGVSVAEGNAADALLSYATVRAAVATLAKDIKTATSTLSMVVRSVFRARLGDVLRLEARTGVIGSFQRFFEACDVARNEDLSAKKRTGALTRAREHLETIKRLSESSEDSATAGRYVSREIARIPFIKNVTSADEQAFNDLLLQCNKLKWQP